MLIGPHRCDKQVKKPKREEIISRGSKRDRKEGKRSQRQQQEQQNQDREKRARIDQEEDRDEDQMMDTDQVEDISVVGTRKSTSHSLGAIGFAFHVNRLQRGDATARVLTLAIPIFSGNLDNSSRGT